MRRPLLDHISDHFATNELTALWLFSAGTVTTIPITCMLCYFRPTYPGYWVGLIASIACSVAIVLFTIDSYPSGDPQQQKPYYLLGRLAKRIPLRSEGCIPQKHLASDFTIACWFLLLGCTTGVIACAVLLVRAVRNHDLRDQYDWSTA